MRKSIIIGLGLGLCVSFNAYAGEWKQDSNGWWWQNDDGTFPTNCWQWLDGNSDGIFECYFFGNDGYLLSNTQIEGYQVDTNGAWIENGHVQTKGAEESVSEDTELMLQLTQTDFPDDMPAIVKQKIESLGIAWPGTNQYLKIKDWYYCLGWDYGPETFKYNWYLTRGKEDGSVVEVLHTFVEGLGGWPSGIELSARQGKLCFGNGSKYYQYDLRTNQVRETTKEMNNSLKQSLGSYNPHDNLYYLCDIKEGILYVKNYKNETIRTVRLSATLPEFSNSDVVYYGEFPRGFTDHTETIAYVFAVPGKQFLGASQYTVEIEIDINTGEVIRITR